MEQGQIAEIKNFPYHVTIHYASCFVCNGAIVSPNWVLTTASCAPSIPLRGMVIAGTGEKNKSSGSYHRILEIVRRNHESDAIALIKVIPPFDIDETRRPIELFQQGEKVAPGAVARVPGYGHTDDVFMTSRLRYLEAPILDSDSCLVGESPLNFVNKSLRKKPCRRRTIFSGISQQQPSKHQREPEGSVCVGHDKQGRKACYGNDGSPLVVDGRLAGVGRRDSTLYTEIARDRDWIDEIFRVEE